MAWVDIGERAALIDGSTTRGWAHFQYNDAGGTTTRSCRIVIEPKSGSTFTVAFNSITITGVSGTTSVANVTQNYTGADSQHPAVWTGDVPAGRNVTATWTNPWWSGSKYPSVTGYLPSGGTAPTGGAITYNSCTWNSVNITSSVTSWGGLTGNFQAIVITGSSNGDAANAVPGSWNIGRKVYNKNSVPSSTLSYTVNATDLNVSTSYNNPIAIKGLLHYKLAYWNYNTAGRVDALDNTLRYLPPAPGQFAYTDPGGVGSKTFAVTFTGDTSNNHTVYDSAELTRNIRYSLDNGTTWTSVVSAVTALDAVTSFNVTVPAGDIAIVEAYEVYHGMSSDVQSISLPNTNSPVGIYGSVNGESVAIRHLYGSVDGRTKKIVKLYASVGGVAKKVFIDE